MSQVFRPQGASPSAAPSPTVASAGPAAVVGAPGANGAGAPGPEVVALGFPDGAPPPTAGGAGTPRQILVQWEAGCGEGAREAALARCGGQRQALMQTSAMKAAGEGVMEVIRLPAEGDLEAVLAAYGRTAGVRYAEVDRKLQRQAVSNDPRYADGSLWGMYGSDASGAVGPAGTTNAFGTQAENAWNRGFLGSRSVFVGIIDEGFDSSHPDLAPNAWVNPFDPADGIDNDGNGYVDDVRGWDFYNNDNSTFDGPGDDHGTHVAGTIGAAGGNGIGVAGINWNVSLISAKFLGDAGGYLSGAIQSLDYFTDLKIRHGLNIVATNNSWGGGGYSQALQDAITRAARQNILFIAAAGNDASNNDVTLSYPSSYNTTATAGYDAVIAVASITSDGALSSFSNYGSTTVDLGAPGSSVLSTLPGNNYGFYSGTSMATPHVTGAAALYAASNPGATAQQIRTALLSSTTPTPSLAGRTVTGGRLNVETLLSRPLPVLSISSSQLQKPEGNSGVTAFTFTVSRSGDLTGSSSVQWSVAGSGANPADGADFGGALPGGTVTFTSGVTAQTITVNVAGDTTVEANETFTVNLFHPVGATLGGGVSSAAATIGNDDQPVVTLAISPASVVEDGATNLVYTFTRTGPTTNPLTVSFVVGGTATSGVDYAQAGAASYTTSAGSIAFAAGSSTANLTIDPTADGTVEADETVSLTLQPGTGYTVGTAVPVVGTILNDDALLAPTLSIAADATSRPEGNSGVTAFTFTVSRSGDLTGSSSVQWSVAGSGANPADGADFGGALPGGTVTFTSGVTAQTITVNVAGDTTVEANETFTVNLFNPVGATLGGGVSSAAATIGNDDQPVVTLAISPASVVEDGATNLVYTFTRTGPTTNPLTVSFVVGGTATSGVDYAQAGAASYTTSAGSIAFAAGSSTANLTIDPTADTIVEANETVAITLSNGSGYTSGTTTAVVGTIVNDDGPLTFSNSSTLLIPDLGASNPFPSTVNVSGLSNVTVASVQVSLYGLNHSWPDDLDILLVGPTGARSLVMSDAGGSTRVSNINLTFSSQAGSAVPDNAALVATTYRPADYQKGDLFSSPAPAGPYTADFSVFNGTNPNGTWSLFVQDDSRGDSGSIARGWALTLTTSPLPASTSPRGSASSADPLTNFVMGRDRIASASIGDVSFVPMAAPAAGLKDAMAGNQPVSDLLGNLSGSAGILSTPFPPMNGFA